MTLFPRRFLQGCAALLALALSALGGSRIGFDRLVGGDGRVDDQAVVRRADAAMAMAAGEVASSTVQNVACQFHAAAPYGTSDDGPIPAATPAVAPRDCPAPAMLLGSSRGPRAP